MISTANAPIDEGLDQSSIEERRALIERVAASSHFGRSARLRDFLLYVGGQSLKEGCPEIHEQEIGAKVFGRPASYDRSQDNIVRVNATELRKRIEQYFATEGAHETLILEIPRGGYKPVFHRRVPQAEETPATSRELVPQTFRLPRSPSVRPRLPSQTHSRVCGRPLCGSCGWLRVPVPAEPLDAKDAVPMGGEAGAGSFLGGFSSLPSTD